MTVLSLTAVALAGFAGGAVLTVTVVFVGLKLNLKGMGDAYSGVRQDARFYRWWALTGGAIGAAWSTAIPILDASDIKEPWYGLIMIATGLVLFVPMMRFLKRHRGGGAPPT